MYYYPPTMTVYEDDPEFDEIVADCKKHYGFSADVEGGIKFFETIVDYETWKAAK